MERPPSMNDQFLATVNLIIDKNINNEYFSVEDLANQAGISRSMLHRRLKKLTGKSASTLITEKRLAIARGMLENDEGTASEIAYKVGFRDANYFFKVFKKHYNISAGQVRKQINHQEDQGLIEDNKDETKPASSHDFRIIYHIIAILTIIIILGVAIYYFSYKTSRVENSIAVLPLDNLTGNPENTFFIDGIQDALIGELGRIKSLRVISRTSTLRYRNYDMLLPDIARDLQVNFVLEGSVQQLGDSLYLIVQLIDVFPKERHLFTNKYLDGLENVLTMQSTVARDVAKKIRINLTKDEEELLARSQQLNPEAYKLYLTGMSIINQGTTASFEEGVSYLHKAIKKDPSNSLSYASLALAYALRGHALIAPEESFRSSEAQAIKALRIDPASDEAHTALALLYLYKFWDWGRAKTAFENALLSNPNNEIAHAHFAWYHLLFGDIEKAIYHARMAVILEPYSASYNSWLAMIYYFDENFQDAEYYTRKSLELNEDIIFGKLVLGWIYLEKGEISKAIEIHEQLPKTQDYYLNFLGYTYIVTGNRDKAQAIWDDLESNKGKQFVNPACKGLLAGMLGYTDEAFDLLNEAIDRKIYPIIHLETFNSADFIRDDPRYDQLFQRMDLPVVKDFYASK